MAIAHHPDVSTLMSFAAGTLPEPLAAVVAAHLDMCPLCAREVRLMERLGGALVERLPEAAMSTGVPSVSDAPRLAAAPASADLEVAPLGSSSMPRPLAKLLGTDLDHVAWKRLGYGVWHYPLALSPGVGGDLRLLKVAPGMAMPEHGHGGSELTLMLRGSYSDKIGTFRSGDVADLDEDVEHQPVADRVEGCICLIASERKARFRGILARLVQPFTGI